MRHYTKFLMTALLAWQMLSHAPFAPARGRMAQLVFSFDSERIYNTNYDKQKNVVILEIRNTSPEELKGLEHYDESVVRRVLVKEQGNRGTEVRFVLRDRNVRASISDFKEPFRISVDFFDKNYQTSRDPITGMPISAGDHAASPVNAPSASKYELAQSSPSTAPAAVDSTPAGTKRRLLQPSPEIFASPGDFKQALAGTSPGVGKQWQNFPIYVYRVQTASLHSDGKRDSWLKANAGKAMSSSAAMADYAGRLFDFGHENRALMAYQQVLHKDPSVFDKSPLHLWKFAEVHLGQGNLTLADGYYQALVEKHQESPLSGFARMRRLDVRAIRAMSSTQTVSLAELGKRANAIVAVKNPELAGQLSIRKAYWSKSTAANRDAFAANRYHLPTLTDATYKNLQNALSNVEGQKTAFLISTLMLEHMLTDSTPWQKSTGTFAGQYFKRYRGKSTKVFLDHLANKIQQKINKSLQTDVTAGNVVKAIQDYEALPKNLRSVDASPATAWALAEAYRKLGQAERSIKFYDLAGKNQEAGPDRLRAKFWLAVNASQVRNELKGSGRNPSRVAYLGKKARAADQAMASIWAAMKDNEKTDFLNNYKNHLERVLVSDNLLRTPPSILLEKWTKSLASATAASPANNTAVKASYSPSANTVDVLTNLAKRFSELGMNSKRQQTLLLLKYMKPTDFADSSEAKQAWADQLLTLANEYREASKYLEAGRIFAYTGKESQDWPQRAESLYKGGLLLYRAGQREEAIQAFTQCGEDGNNRYYANLCTERLDRLNNQ